MKIETYEVEPVDQSEMQALAADGEAALLIQELGLDGQKALLETPTATPFPYRHMTEQEQKVYEFHCPIKTELRKYQSDFIPLRVLQVAAHVKNLGFCDKGLHVWHPKDAKLDPVLVGLRSIPGQQWGQEIYILARWGAVWKDFATLLKEAITGWCATRRAKIDKAQQELESSKKTVEADAQLFFSGHPVDGSLYF